MRSREDWTYNVAFGEAAMMLALWGPASLVRVPIVAFAWFCFFQAGIIEFVTRGEPPADLEDIELFRVWFNVGLAGLYSFWFVTMDHMIGAVALSFIVAACMCLAGAGWQQYRTQQNRAEDHARGPRQ